MRAKVGVARERGGLLRVHFGVGERLVVGAAPAVEVDRLRLLGLFEELAPARGARLRRFDLLRARGREGALKVAPKRDRVAHAVLDASAGALAT